MILSVPPDISVSDETLIEATVLQPVLEAAILYLVPGSAAATLIEVEIKQRICPSLITFSFSQLSSSPSQVKVLLSVATKVNPPMVKLVPLLIGVVPFALK